jgi:hypothetical protein
MEMGVSMYRLCLDENVPSPVYYEITLFTLRCVL